MGGSDFIAELFRRRSAGELVTLSLLVVQRDVGTFNEGFRGASDSAGFGISLLGGISFELSEKSGIIGE